MELLTPAKINKERKQADEDSADRTNKLAQEESRIARLINQARQKAKQAIDDVEVSYGLFLKDHKQRVAIARDEVTALENRRTASLEPVLLQKKEAEGMLKDAQDQMDVAIERFTEVASLKEQYLSGLETFHDIRGTLELREYDIISRENAVKIEEEASKIRLNEANNAWVSINVATIKLNARTEAIERQEIAIQQSEKATSARHQEQDSRERDLNDLETSLQDRYATLERTINHLKQ